MDSQDNKRKWKIGTSLQAWVAITGILLRSRKSAICASMPYQPLQQFLLVWYLGFLRQNKALLCSALPLVIAFEVMNSTIENVVVSAINYHFSMLAKCQKYGAGAVMSYQVCPTNRTGDFCA